MDGLERLADYLDPTCFPCDREQLLEAGVLHHAPTTLLQALCGLPHGKDWQNVPEVVDELRSGGACARDCSGGD